ncbi:hypothetical protein GNZ12_15945 [Paraburkholderia sp. 1N]|uniref:Uncharacterized protein n=1 Tax=Paraburkholderia solitsugae TaxID=2675748 RepID=A0ABX2BRZ6_9BURK|nr:hypothetical protein [Paraburkholderia solitsugae]NPT42775.1 hypothetical protein [Paraburkholderia solitsugae]
MSLRNLKLFCGTQRIATLSSNDPRYVHRIAQAQPSITGEGYEHYP